MTTTLTTNFEIPIPPLDTAGTADGYGTLMQSADTAIFNASGKGAWVDYSATSTINGWSSFTEKHILYKKIGNIVFVMFQLTGTSDAIVAEFSLPYASAAATVINIIIRVIDNSGAATTGLLTLADLDDTAGCAPAVSGGGWTAGGTKSVVGQFFYEVA